MNNEDMPYIIWLAGMIPITIVLCWQAFTVPYEQWQEEQREKLEQSAVKEPSNGV